MKEILRLSRACQDDRPADALRDYNLEVYEGDILYIQGSAGSGIRTLAAVLAGDCCLKKGSLFLYGKKTLDYSRNTAYRYHIYTVTAGRDLVEKLNVAENLEAVRYLPFPLQYYSRGHAQVQTRGYLEKEQVDIRAEEAVWRLSGGDRQKLSILKAKMHGAKLIVLDVTDGDLEGRQAEEICRLIQRVRAEGISFIILSGTYSMFAGIASRIQVISDGIDLKEWRGFRKEARQYLQERLFPVSPHGNEYRSKGKPDGKKDLFGLYDFEWETEKGLWQYLQKLRRDNRELWDTEIRADIPEDGCSLCRRTVLIPRSSEEKLVRNLSVADNVILTIPERIGKSGIIRRSVRKNVADRYYRRFSVNPVKSWPEELSRIERKLLSIFRWELAHPEILILESPCAGLEPEETGRLWAYLTELSGTGIRVFVFSRFMEELQAECSTILVSENGKSAKIATF